MQDNKWITELIQQMKLTRRHKVSMLGIIFFSFFAYMFMKVQFLPGLMSCFVIGSVCLFILFSPSHKTKSVPPPGNDRTVKTLQKEIKTIKQRLLKLEREKNKDEAEGILKLVNESYESIYNSKVFILENANTEYVFDKCEIDIDKLNIGLQQQLFINNENEFSLN